PGLTQQMFTTGRCAVPLVSLASIYRTSAPFSDDGQDPAHERDIALTTSTSCSPRPYGVIPCSRVERYTAWIDPPDPIAGGATTREENQCKTSPAGSPW